MISILEIDEIGQKFKNQFNLYITWFDFRLKLYNMKMNLNMNTLTSQEKKSIWVPKLVFINTEKKENTQNDNKAFAVARRDNAFEFSDESVKDNIYMFDGSKNPFVMSRVYDVDWICDFDMRWYPFDTQVRFDMRWYHLDTQITCSTCFISPAAWFLILMEILESLLILWGRS